VTRGRLAIVFVLALAACVQPSVVHCDDGRTCPAGTVCTTNGLCALPVQLTACEEIDEGAACSYPGTSGVCLGGVCTGIGCGNGIRDLGEVCDDGNLVSGDGCSSDCQSNEQCGDRDPNPFLGEECDDGNRLDHDGCSSTCLKETGRWTRIDNGPPARRRNAAIAYDSLRERVVLFGGVAGGNLLYNDTWEWDGTQWTRIETPASPAARQGAAMAFDPNRQRIVLFGGLGTSTLADTWEYSGSTWTPVVVPSTPSPRYAHALAYDGSRKRVVMVGGTNVATIYRDAFAWEGDRWEPLPAFPQDRMDHAMAYDPIRGQLVLFSGRPSTVASAVDDAWTLDANGWAPLPASGAPRAGAGATFDVANGRILVFGGTPDGVTTSAESTLSAWNGTAWSTVTIAAPPSPRTQAAVTYDIANRELIVFGGYLQDFSFDNNTFALGSSWRTAPTPLAPSSTRLASAWDPERNAALVVGSAASTDTTAQTLSWSGGFSVLPGGPSRRVDAMLARDKTELVLAGGRVPGTSIANDTWSWDGSWSLRQSGGPLPRTSSALAADSSGLVLFGGNPALADTWAWRGGAWSLLATAESPTGRRDHAMAYDPIRQRTVLHGGIEGNTTVGLDDTWEWDGATWSRIAALGAPPRLSYHGMVFDPLRQRIVTIGEDNAAGTGLAEWDGATWSPVSVATPGPAMTTFTAFYDAVGKGIVVIGPISSTSANDVWRFRYQSTSADEICGSGLDADRDGLVDCFDPDCWYVCTPGCSPGVTCDPSAARCGDGTCDAPIETCSTCSADCGACPAVCGDFICSQGETCAGDC
jgi:cysteine-rich repeat protein